MEDYEFVEKYLFDPHDLYGGLDKWLAHELSRRILAWVEVGVMNDDDWIEELKTAGEALREYAKPQIRITDTVHKNARDAMFWIAENFGVLWD